jgi:hypothetical protein
MINVADLWKPKKERGLNNSKNPNNKPAMGRKRLSLAPP